MVQITRKDVGGLGLSIKGGAEHKLPILISRIYKDQAADVSGKLFVGDAIIKVSFLYRSRFGIDPFKRNGPELRSFEY